MVPAVWMSGCSALNVMAATMGKKISAPSQTISDKESSVRSKVFMDEGYRKREQGIAISDRQSEPNLLTPI
jgi:hypothetical protein